MEINKLLSINTVAELREWMNLYSTTEEYCWVVCSIKPEIGKLLYLDVVEVALCYGWVDGIKKKITPVDTAQRLSPRAKKSSWTELNKERVRRLYKLGLMTPAGESVLPNMEVQNFEIHNEILKRLSSDREVYRNFENMPELYKRIRIDNIQKVQHDYDLYNKRLDKFITSVKENKLIGQWHDHGRLLNY